MDSGKSDSGRMVWMDLEMTGLDPAKDRIIEMATIITDGQLEIVAEGPVFAVDQPRALLDGMDDWNTNQHSKSGLLKRIAEEGVSEAEAEALTLEFISAHVEERAAPLCGNTIWQDRRFLSAYMPTLEGYLFYRMVDVSSVKELANRWRPDLAPFKKKNEHTALADIRESIEELKYFREHFFKN